MRIERFDEVIERWPLIPGKLKATSPAIELYCLARECGYTNEDLDLDAFQYAFSTGSASDAIDAIPFVRDPSLFG